MVGPARIAQLVERFTRDEQVSGSNPDPGPALVLEVETSEGWEKLGLKTGSPIYADIDS